MRVYYMVKKKEKKKENPSPPTQTIPAKQKPGRLDKSYCHNS